MTNNTLKIFKATFGVFMYITKREEEVVWIKECFFFESSFEDAFLKAKEAALSVKNRKGFPKDEKVRFNVVEIHQQLPENLNDFRRYTEHTCGFEEADCIVNGFFDEYGYNSTNGLEYSV